MQDNCISWNLHSTSPCWHQRTSSTWLISLHNMSLCSACKVCKVPYWHFCFLKGRCSVELLWSSSSIFYLPHLSLLICHAYHLFPPVLSISSISNCIPYHPIFIFCHSSWRSAWQWSALFRSTSWLLLMLLEHASVSCILIKDFTYQRAAEVQTWKW
jgi:hypothetical protein